MTTSSAPRPPLGDLVYQSEWILVSRLLRGRGRGTHLYEVRAREVGTPLALIVWYRPWRQYILRPKDGSIWKSPYLCDVVTFLEQLVQGSATTRT